MQNDKPIIRHCKNCEWCKEYKWLSHIDCTVTYKTVWKTRLKALFCRYYKEKERKDAE